MKARKLYHNGRDGNSGKRTKTILLRLTLLSVWKDTYITNIERDHKVPNTVQSTQNASGIAVLRKDG